MRQQRICEKKPKKKVNNKKIKKKNWKLYKNLKLEDYLLIIKVYEFFSLLTGQLQLILQFVVWMTIMKRADKYF